MDAYSYIYRCGVFANAKTDDILLLGVRLSQREWAAAFNYLLPILAFIAGLLLANAIKYIVHLRLMASAPCRISYWGNG